MPADAAPPPRPLSATWHSDTRTIDILFDRQLAAGPLATANWTVNYLLGYANPTSAVAAADTVTLATRSDQKPTTVDYAPTQEPRLRGNDGTPAPAFSITVQ